jgi:hypothetical protein
MRRPWTIVFLAAIVVTGGCAVPLAGGQGAEETGQVSRSSPSTFARLDELPELTRTAIEEFPEVLPAGVSWSAAPVLAGAGDDDVVLEAGVVDVALAEYWSCTWMAAYIGAADAGDDQRSEAALSHLDRYASLPAIVAHHQNPEVFASSVVQEARTGDAAGLREVFTTCRSLSLSADGATTMTTMAPIAPAQAR